MSICHSNELHTWTNLATKSPLFWTAVSWFCFYIQVMMVDTEATRETAACSCLAAAFPPLSYQHKTLHHSHSGTFTRTLHDLMDDPAEDSLENGIIMVLWCDPHAILCYNMAHDGSQHVYLYSRCLWKRYFGVSHTCKCPAYTADRRFGWLWLVFKNASIKSAEFIC